MATICVGNEFTTDAQGRLKVVIQGSPPDLAWPYPCPVASHNGLKRQPGGGLWTPPPVAFSEASASGAVNTGGSTTVPAAAVVLDQASIQLTNPSGCYSARVLRWVTVDADITLPPGSDSQAGVRLGGNEVWRLENGAPAAGSAVSAHTEVTLPFLASTLAPGQTLTFSVDVGVGGGAGGATYGEVRWAVRAVVLALP
jgi:hypothetical protein